MRVINTYYHNGNLEHRVRYNDDGLLDGLEEYYHLDGTLSSITTYHNGHLSGMEKKISPEGRILILRSYKMNRLVGYCYYFYPKPVISLPSEQFYTI